MKYVLGALIGLLVGAAAGWVNALILKRSFAKSSANAVMATSLARTGIDAAALALVFFALRGAERVSMEAALIAAAASLSVTVIVSSFRLAGKQ